MCNLHGWRMCNYYSYSSSAFTFIVEAKCKLEQNFLKVQKSLVADHMKKEKYDMFFWGYN